MHLPHGLPHGLMYTFILHLQLLAALILSLTSPVTCNQPICDVCRLQVQLLGAKSMFDAYTPAAGSNGVPFWSKPHCQSLCFQSATATKFHR